MAQRVTVRASSRTELGKNAVRRLRNAGMIPATVYGHGKKAASLSLDPTVVMDILRSHSGQNTILQLTIDGKNKSHVLIKDFQLHPIRHQLLHVDLLRIDMTTRLTVKVPVSVMGEPIGVKTGGGLMDVVVRELEVECLPGDIPEHLEVDVSHLELNQVLRVAQVDIPKKLKVLTDPGVVIVTVTPLRAAVEVTTEAPVEEAAEPEVIMKGKGEAEGEGEIKGQGGKEST